MPNSERSRTSTVKVIQINLIFNNIAKPSSCLSIYQDKVIQWLENNRISAPSDIHTYSMIHESSSHPVSGNRSSASQSTASSSNASGSIKTTKTLDEKWLRVLKKAFSSRKYESRTIVEWPLKKSMSKLVNSFEVERAELFGYEQPVKNYNFHDGEKQLTSADYELCVKGLYGGVIVQGFFSHIPVSDKRTTFICKIQELFASLYTETNVELANVRCLTNIVGIGNSSNVTGEKKTENWLTGLKEDSAGRLAQIELEDQPTRKAFLDLIIKFDMEKSILFNYAPSVKRYNELHGETKLTPEQVKMLLSSLYGELMLEAFFSPLPELKKRTDFATNVHHIFRDMYRKIATVD